jgi:ABC-type Na+ transport system ATPase subunit NatA
MPKDIRERPKPKGSTFIRRIHVERLFGYLTYTLPNEKQKASDFDRLMILYGDNGSGKTTILTLVFCLLSPVLGRGEKTHIAHVPVS